MAKPDLSLSTSLLLNAVLSALTGVLLSATPDTVAGWLGLQISGWLRLFGFALVGHFVALLWIRSKQDPIPWVQTNLALVAPYPLALLGILGTNTISSNLGRVLLLTDATLVAFAAVAQWRALKRLTHLQGSA